METETKEEAVALAVGGDEGPLTSVTVTELKTSRSIFEIFMS